MDDRLRIAILGSRGMPADRPHSAGGEREVEAKALRLAARGHEVTVYCRWHYHRHPESPCQGVHLLSLPSIPTKSFDTLSHSLLGTLHVILRNTADVISYHGMGNALLLPLAKLGRKSTVVYLDGVDWERPKWGVAARLALRVAAWMAFKWADRLYVDNQASARVFARMFGRKPEVVTLGAERWEPPGHDLLTGFGLEPDRYILFVGLLRADKNVHLLLDAYRMLETDVPLVIVGDNREEPAYVRSLKEAADPRVRFLGFQYGLAARQLFANSAIYVQPSLMEGNSPALLSAMACGRCCVVNGIEQNAETIGDAGVAVPNDPFVLSKALASLLVDPSKRASLGERARRRVADVYDWEVVVSRLEDVYRAASRRPGDSFS